MDSLLEMERLLIFFFFECFFALACNRFAFLDLPESADLGLILIISLTLGDNVNEDSDFLEVDRLDSVFDLEVD